MPTEQKRLNNRWWKFTHHKEVVVYKREWQHKIRVEALTHYGNGKLACVRCGETRLPCLSIDHIAGGGGVERRKLGRKGNAFTAYLKTQGYPKGYQTLCMNCQFLKAYENREYYGKEGKMK